MTLQQATDKVMALTPEQIRHETATDVMGWILYFTDANWYRDGNRIIKDWRPDEDRNQSRQFTDAVGRQYPKAMTERLVNRIMHMDTPGTYWWVQTPLDECRAGLIAWYWAREQHGGE